MPVISEEELAAKIGRSPVMMEFNRPENQDDRRDTNVKESSREIPKTLRIELPLAESESTEEDEEESEEDSHKKLLDLPFEDDLQSAIESEANKDFQKIELSTSMTNEASMADEAGEKAHKKKRRRRGKKKSKKSTTEGNEEDESSSSDLSSATTTPTSISVQVPFPTTPTTSTEQKQTPQKPAPAKSPKKPTTPNASQQPLSSLRNDKKKSEARDQPSTTGLHTGKHDSNSMPKKFSHSVLLHTRASDEHNHSLEGVRPLRQPFGPSLQGNGFSQDYQRERRARMNQKIIQ